MGRTNLDERQLQKKHKAGNQAFMLLAFLLLADMGLQNYGIHWLEYQQSDWSSWVRCSGSEEEITGMKHNITIVSLITIRSVKITL